MWAFTQQEKYNIFLPLKRSSNLAFSNRWDYIQYLAEEYLRDPGELEVIYRLKLAYNMAFFTLI